MNMPEQSVCPHRHAQQTPDPETPPPQPRPDPDDVPAPARAPVREPDAPDAPVKAC